MLDANLKAQLKSYLERVTQPIEIVAGVQCFVRADWDGAGQGRQPLVVNGRNGLFEQIDPLCAEQR